MWYNGIFFRHKKNEIMSFAATWIQIESTILSQKEKDKYYITYIWDLKHGKNELIYKTETDSKTQRTDQTCVCQEGRGWTGSLGLVDANYYIQNG